MVVAVAVPKDGCGRGGGGGVDGILLLDGFLGFHLGVLSPASYAFFSVRPPPNHFLMADADADGLSASDRCSSLPGGSPRGAESV